MAEAKIEAITQSGCYLVGGAVRDSLLKLKIKERDYVVVGKSPAQMLAAGFSQVGKDFPVFLHPISKEEYALARTERKQGSGHQGFVVHAAPNVTLEEDLKRRDLTINAMALAPAKNSTEDIAANIIDPYFGQQDLAAGILRHVSPAFVEDPLRVLRVARFAAVLALPRIDKNFSVAPATLQLMRQISHFELASLSPERIAQELQLALGAANPLRFFDVLAQVDALFLFCLEQPPNYRCAMRSLALCSALSQDIDLRFAATFATLPTQQFKALQTKLGINKKQWQLATIAKRLFAAYANIHRQDTATVLDFLQTADAWRRPQRYAQILSLCQARLRSQNNNTTAILPQRLFLERAAKVSANICTDFIREQTALNSAAIAARIKQQRLQALAELQNDFKTGQKTALENINRAEISRIESYFAATGINIATL